MTKEECLQIVREIFSHNQFVKHCKIIIDDVDCGWAKLHMTVDANIHVNPAGFVHGGALTTLANTAVGVACCTVGARTVTLNITTDFMANTTAGHTISAEAVVVHRGHQTVVLDVNVFDDNHKILCHSMATMFIKADDEKIPRKW